MLKKTSAAIIASLFVAGSAQAAFIAGWDFGQYAGPGAPTLDGATLASQVAATYSDFDPTFGAGAESAAYGTLYLDGSNGSTAGGGGLLVPTSDVISLLQALPQNGTPAGDVPFDSGAVQVNEGATNFGIWQDVSMLSQGVLDAVFAADLGAGSADSFSIELAGVSLAAAGTIDVAYSTDGLAYTPFTTLNIGTTEQAYLVDLAGTALDGGSQAFVRLSFGGANLAIDNVGISGVNASVVPEPSAAVLTLLGLAGLFRAGRTRQ